jgi:two-component system phosphate regulon sensor histidine kinase PhoR
VKRVFGRGEREHAAPGLAQLQLEARRGQLLVEESREIVVVLDESDRVLAASRRAREALEGLLEGAPFPDALLREDAGRTPLRVSYDVDGQRESLLYLGEKGDLAAYEELRAGFTAAVSHELRTPLARLLVLLESAVLPGADPAALIDEARAEVDQIRELIDDVLFLSELESGREVVSLGSTRALPILERVVRRLEDRAEAAGVTLELRCPASIDLPLRPRMLEVVVTNLTENAIRYAGPGSTFTLAAGAVDGAVTLTASDDGTGVPGGDLGRLFERFYRADRARSSRGTGLGLAIVKHVIGAAGGTVEAAASTAGGLEIRSTFPRAGAV